MTREKLIGWGMAGSSHRQTEAPVQHLHAGTADSHDEHVKSGLATCIITFDRTLNSLSLWKLRIKC